MFPWGSSYRKKRHRCAARVLGAAGFRVLAGLCLLVVVTAAAAQNLDRVRCGERGVAVQILGSGAGELGAQRAGPSYLVWLDGQARLLVNTGPGTALRFSEAGADFADLEAIVFTQLSAEHIGDLPALLSGARVDDRSALPVLGPAGNDAWPSLETVVSRLIGADGAFPALADYLEIGGDTRFRLSLREVPSSGTRRWAQFGSDNMSLAAIPVHHGPLPAIAWRVEIGGHGITIAGAFNNQQGTVPDFAAGSTVLIVHHGATENARGPIRDLHVRPSQIGRIAADADVGTVILGARAQRTIGFQTQTLDHIEAQFSRRVTFADDLQCLLLR